MGWHKKTALLMGSRSRTHHTCHDWKVTNEDFKNDRGVESTPLAGSQKQCMYSEMLFCQSPCIPFPMQSPTLATTNDVSIKALPEWICNLIDIGEWLHTGSRMSTPATELTETLYRSGKSGGWKIKEKSQVSEEKVWSVWQYDQNVTIIQTLLSITYDTPNLVDILIADIRAILKLFVKTNSLCFLREVIWSQHVTRYAESVIAGMNKLFKIHGFVK